MDEHLGPLAYDLRHYLHISLPLIVEEMCRDDPKGCTPRYLALLISQLPDDGALAASLQGGDQHRGWGQDRYLQAAIFDAIQTNTMASGNWKKRPPKLKPYPTPTTKPRVVSLDEALPF